MNNILYYISFILSVILSSLRPLLFKRYKEYFFITVYLSNLSMYLGSLLYMMYESKEKENYGLINHIKKTFLPKNIILSIMSSIRFISKQLSYILLPLSVSVPLTNLWIISAVIFDKILYAGIISSVQYISIGILLLGAILVSFDKIIGNSNRNISTMNYFYGLFSVLISIIFGGYVYTKFKDIVSVNLDPGFTMGIESGGSVIALTLIMIVGYMFNLFNIPKVEDMVIIFLLLTFLFNISIILKFIGFEKVPLVDTILISQSSIIVSVLVGFLYFKESITIHKIIGIIAIIIGSVIGIIFHSRNIKNEA